VSAGTGSAKLKLLTLLFLFTSALIFTLFSCSSPTNPDLLPSLTITVDGVTSTEAFIKLSTNNISLPASVSLSRNNKQIKNFTLITADTTIIDKSLNPNQNYTYSAELTDANNQKAVSQKVVTQTMDTTSHNFSWQTYTFGGQGGSSTLYDVAIINENDIWAVGEMYVYDSTGTPVLYNAVHWDGSKWELKRILYKGLIWSIRTIYAFNSNDIWFSAFVRYDGKKFIDLPIPDILIGWSVNKIWGTSSNDLYVVGNGGNIAHYNGTSWQKVNSGTTTNINDIWGFYDDNTSQKNILCAVSNRITAGDYKILVIENNTVDSITWNTNRRVQSIWFEDNLKIFASGGGVFINNGDNKWYEQNELPLISTNRIRGTAKNDVFVGGDFGLLAHYNGLNWKVYPEANVALFYSLDYKNNLLTAVGERNGKAVVLMMRR